MRGSSLTPGLANFGQLARMQMGGERIGSVGEIGCVRADLVSEGVGLVSESTPEESGLCVASRAVCAETLASSTVAHCSHPAVRLSIGVGWSLIRLS